MATDRYSLSNKCNTDAGIKKKLTIAEQRGANPYSFSVQLVCAPAGGLAPPFPTFLLSVFHYERGDKNKNWNASPLTLFNRKNIFTDLIIVNHIYRTLLLNSVSVRDLKSAESSLSVVPASLRAYPAGTDRTRNGSAPVSSLENNHFQCLNSPNSTNVTKPSQKFYYLIVIGPSE